MKRLMTIAAALFLVVASSAQAEGTKGGLGFRAFDGAFGTLPNSGGNAIGTTPTVGVRHWFTEKVGADVAIGFTSVSIDAGKPSKTVTEGTGLAVDIGIPFVAKKMDKVNFIVRPGFLYGTAVAKDKTLTTAPNEITNTLVAVSGELEVEYMLTDNLSISASHGIQYRSLKSEDNASPKNELFTATGFTTMGSNFTQLGFHVYLW